MIIGHFLVNLIASNTNSSDASVELTEIIPITDFNLSGVSLQDFPVEDFFKVPFTHHVAIFSKVKNLKERYYYIHRVVEENLSVDRLEILIKQDAYKHQKELPNNFERTITPSSLARKAVEIFNRELNCLVVVELKRGEFKPAYLGQLSAYLRIVDDKLKKPHENRAIGIVLCKSMNKQFAEYVIQDYDKPLGVTTYKSLSEMPEAMQKVLPDINDMENFL